MSDEAAHKVYKLVFEGLEAQLISCAAQVEAASVSVADMQQAVQRVLPPGDLRRYALEEGEQAVRKLRSPTTRSGAPRTDGADSLALCMGPCRCAQRALQLTGAEGEAAGAYLAAVLEYVTAELGEACGKVDEEEDGSGSDSFADDDGLDKWVTARHVQAAFEQHAELRVLWQVHVAG